MYLISDAVPTEQDVAKYVSMQKTHRKELLTKRQANKLRRKQDELVNNYVYTTEDIEKNLEERKKQGKSVANMGLEQTKAAIAVQAAKDSLQEAKRAVTEARKALDMPSADSATRDLESALKEAQNFVKVKEKELQKRKEEEQALKDQVKDRKRRLAQRSKDKNWAKVNQRNIQKNQRTDFEVSQKEKEAKEKADKKVAAGGVEKFDPFARRKVKPKILWKVGQSEDKEAQQDKKPVEEEKKDSRGEPDVMAAETTPNLVQEQQDKADATSQSHLFTIDEEVLAQDGANGFSRLSSSKRPRRERVRKGLSLTEYLDRKAKGAL
jgi:RNA polymerase-associated protein RTF1